MQKQLFKEPLLAFTLAGGLIFLLYAGFAGPEREHIQLTADAVADLVKMRSELLDRPLTDAERRELVKHHIHTEILIREAVARGLHLRDPRIRKRLLEKMYFLLDEEPPKPTEDELRTFYETRPEDYRIPPTVSFEHLFFKDGREKADALIQQLNSGRPLAEDIGDIFWLGRNMDHYTAGQLLTVLGFEFEQALENLPLGKWAGPIRSARGWHIVRIKARHPARPLPIAERNRRLRADWVEQWKLDQRFRLIDELSKHYQVVLPTAEYRD